MVKRSTIIIGLLAAVVLLTSQLDWSFAGLRIWMTASQPLAAGEAPYRGLEGETGYTATAITDELKLPWSFSFLPSGDILVSERRGSLQRLITNGTSLQEIDGVPEVYFKGQGGLLDVAVHPQFESNQLIYLSYSAPIEGGSTTRLARARLVENELQDLSV